MKKFMILTALVAFALVSCSKTAILEQPAENTPQVAQQQAINLSNFVHKATKATETTTTTLQAGFKSSAYLTKNASETSFFSNITVSYESSVYKTGYYWPNEGTMSFYAVYPSTLSITNKTIAGYTTTGATDVVVASAFDEDCATHAATASTVDLSFNHILTQIYFQAKGKIADLTYKVEKIEVVAKDNATYTYSTSFANSSWSTPTSDAKTYTYNDTQSSPVEFTGSSLANYGTAAANSLMLVPQSAATVKVYYKVYGVVPNSSPAQEYLIADFTGSNYKSFTTGTWNKGTKLLYALTLPAGTEPIEFTAIVNSWDADTVNVGDGSTGSIAWN